jgi:hypothetical protein
MGDLSPTPTHQYNVQQYNVQRTASIVTTSISSISTTATGQLSTMVSTASTVVTISVGCMIEQLTIITRNNDSKTSGQQFSMLTLVIPMRLMF